VLVAGEAVAGVGFVPGGQVGDARAGHHVVAHDVAGDRPRAHVERRDQGDAGHLVVLHPVALDDVVDAAEHEDAVAGRLAGRVDGRRVRVGVVVDEVADDRRLALGRVQLVVAAVGHEAGAVVAPHRVDDEQVAAGVRARVAEAVVLGHDVGDHGVAGVALADVEPGVRAARAVAVLEQARHRVEGVDAVVAVVDGRQVRAPVPLDAGPEEAVRRVVLGGHVLDGDAVRVEHADAVVQLELAVEHDLVAVGAPDDDVGGRDRDGLVVGALGHEHEVAGGGRVDRLLDGRVLVGDGADLLGGGVEAPRLGLVGRRLVVVAARSSDEDEGCGRGAEPSGTCHVIPQRWWWQVIDGAAGAGTGRLIRPRPRRPCRGRRCRGSCSSSCRSRGR
jgi:hypothetical protein